MGEGSGSRLAVKSFIQVKTNTSIITHEVITRNKYGEGPLWALRQALQIELSHPTPGGRWPHGSCVSCPLQLLFGHGSLHCTGTSACASTTGSEQQWLRCQPRCSSADCCDACPNAPLLTAVKAEGKTKRSEGALGYHKSLLRECEPKPWLPLCHGDLRIWSQQQPVNPNCFVKCRNIVFSILDDADVSCVCLNFSKESPFS